ncbi:Fur family transcriptional regulator [Amphiplicatus metriothermophilus]|uniref:Fur family transcriptional regulator, zinc uptake regulator n=1 Tax=Amphiplicatus metriothermophilus TaxID=1519374 RepID=A0A239PTB3_9PROT|nr:hypothetical protein [Amphiplicatus metriothermophilus]MBB5519289.1 Fur family zinc uptake transcriptional regulator [Amphiplicatus metriothermophilus]SNT73358.1 Fur family transcriptional regulator, zinc uptake regulator [Amphiplicatus metriothermophilus]
MPRNGARRQAVAQAAFKRNERIVLDILQAVGRPMKAYEILEQAYTEGVTAPMTIYRALAALIEAGHAAKIAGINAFVARVAGERKGPAAYFICRRCGEALERPLGDAMLNALFGEAADRLDTVIVEAYGACGRCAPAAKSRA